MANPRTAPKPKMTPKPKVSPGARAAAIQQAAANKQFASAQQALRTKAAQARAGRVVKVHGNPKAQPLAKPLVTRTTSSSNPSAARQMNPLQKLLTPGSGGIANAMKGKGGALTRSGR